MSGPSTDVQLCTVGVALAELRHLKPNPVQHGAVNMEAVKASLQDLGQLEPLLVRRATNEVIHGNARLDAMRELGWTTCAVIYLDVDAARAVAIAAIMNRTGDLHQWSLGELAQVIKQAASFDFRKYGFADYELSTTQWAMPAPEQAPRSDVPEQAAPDYGPPTEEQRGALLRQWIVPPMTVLDARAGYWRERKRSWLDRMGNLSATREMVLARSSTQLLASINDGTSNFDPVLAEVMLRWFCPPGGRVLDPFAGEQTKGFVAGSLGLRYVGLDVREDQLQVNRTACQQLEGVEYVLGDSTQFQTTVSDFDCLLTSPPYYDLEIYTAGARQDMSAVPSYGQFIEQLGTALERGVQALVRDAFVVIKVGEVRDGAGFPRGFVGKTWDLLEDLNCRPYNEFILLTPMGTAQLRANCIFGSGRKAVRVHQHIIVAVKGDLKRALAALGPYASADEVEQMLREANAVEG